MPFSRFEEDQRLFERLIVRLETYLRLICRKQIGGGQVMISEIGHTQKGTPSMACEG